MKNKVAFITGATSGIGMATAKVFAKNGVKIVICGRREERLHELSKEFSQSTKVHTLNFDVRNRKAVEAAIASLPEEFSAIDILINNAGNAYGLTTIDEGNPDDWDAMIDINVKGLLYVSRAILPQMVSRKSGQVINIGSTAGKEVHPKGNVYCGTKHAADALNQAMRMDLNGEGIKIGAINPGFVETELSEVRSKGECERAEKVYENYTPPTPGDIVDIIWFAVTRPPHVNIADLTVMCLDQASAMIVHKNEKA